MSDKKYEKWLELMKDTPKEELLKYHYNLLFKVNKQKEVLDKIKEYILEVSQETLNNGRVFYNGTPAQTILELLEGIE